MSRFLLCYRLVSDGALWSVLNSSTLEECVRHIENYPLEKQAFFVVEIKDASFDFQTRMLGDRVKNLTPVFVGGKDDPEPFLPKAAAVLEVAAGGDAKKSTKQNAVAQRLASLAAKEAKLAEASKGGGEEKASAPTEKKSEKAEKSKPEKTEKAEKGKAEKVKPEDVKVEKSSSENKTETKTKSETAKKSAVGAPKLTSSAVSFNGRALVWAAAGPSSTLSAEERKLFCENVDSALRQGVGISQGCHDQYVQSCFTLNRNVALVAGEAPVSVHTKLEEGVLKFEAGSQAKADITGLPNPEAEAFIKSVEYSISSGRGVTQAVHDKYVALCVARGHDVAHVGGGNAPKAASPAPTSTQSSNASSSSSAPSSAAQSAPEKSSRGTQASTKNTTQERKTAAPEGKQAAAMAPSTRGPIQILESESFDGFQARKAASEADRGAVNVNTNEGGKANASGGVDQLQARAAAQQARIHQLMESLDKEITRQMNDHAEIQRLRIANTRLALDNSRLEASLK